VVEVVEIIDKVFVVWSGFSLVQVRHSITRNYPILAHFRFLLEEIRPEL